MNIGDEEHKVEEFKNNYQLENDNDDNGKNGEKGIEERFINNERDQGVNEENSIAENLRANRYDIRKNRSLVNASKELFSNEKVSYSVSGSSEVNIGSVNENNNSIVDKVSVGPLIF